MVCNCDAVDRYYFWAAMNKPEKIFSELAVVARIQSKAGTRYQSAQLAKYFGVPTARMTEVLVKLVAANKVRRVRCGGCPTMYYLPTEAQLKAEAKMKVSGPSPVVVIRVESENDQVRRELGFGMIEAREA